MQYKQVFLSGLVLISVCLLGGCAPGAQNSPPELPERMRGIHTFDTSLTADLFELLEKTDMNVIRVAINADSGTTNLPTADNPLAPYEANLAVLDQALPRAEQAGIKLILTAADHYGRKLDVMWKEVDSSAEVRNHLPLFWEAMAKRYKDHPVIVAYDILNEPNYPEGKSDFWYEEMLPKSVQAIRRVNSTIWLVIEPGPWGLPTGFDSMPLLDDPYVIYSFHHYAPHSYTHQLIHAYTNSAVYPGQNSMWGDPPFAFWTKEDLRDNMQPAIDFARKHNVRMLVGEFGVIRWAEGADQWLEDSIALFEEYGWDWCFHSLGGWNGWSPTYGTNAALGHPSLLLRAADGGDRGGRWQVMTNGWSLNRLNQSH